MNTDNNDENIAAADGSQPPDTGGYSKDLIAFIGSMVALCILFLVISEILL